MTYFRIHSAEIAYKTKEPVGLFVTVWYLVEKGLLTEDEVAEYWKNRKWFEENLPIPPFYESGNPDGAITWYKDNERGRDMCGQMQFYRDMAKKYGVQLYKSESDTAPGEIIYEDDFQIAVKNVDKASVRCKELG